MYLLRGCSIYIRCMRRILFKKENVKNKTEKWQKNTNPISSFDFVLAKSAKKKARKKENETITNKTLHMYCLMTLSVQLQREISLRCVQFL